MPSRKKLKLIYHRSYTDASFPCEFCGYYTKSETAMRLHRKTRHEITEKYEHPSVVILCMGCNKPKQNCKCKKS